MLASVLRRSQAQLQGHRRWLQVFLSNARPTTPTQRPIRAHLESNLPKWQSRHYAYHTPKHVRRRQKREREAEEQAQLNPEGQLGSDLDHALQQAITDVDMSNVISIFQKLPNYQSVDRNATWRICQCLHEGLRRQRRLPSSEHRSREIDEMVAFAEQLVKLIRKGDLAPDGRAHLHLLSFFKESGVVDPGVAFWRWLEDQDDHYVNPDVYGAAIDMLAAAGSPLSEMEELYERALERFPGTFSAYHLSPNAVLPDREAPTTIPGIPMVLLQGILTARLLRGASRDAYLALDTALRLYPTQTPPRFFKLFVDERPIAEAFSVFAMACRAGITLPQDQVRTTLSGLRKQSNLDSMTEHVSALRKMLLTAYLYLAGGSRLSGNMLNEFIIAITQTLRLEGASALETSEKRRIAASASECIRALLTVFARFGVVPGISAFNSIITNLAGFGDSKQMINICLENAASIGLKPSHVTHRSILTSAGLIKDQDLVVSAWHDLMEARSEEGQALNISELEKDLNVLVKAAKSSGAVAFARETCNGIGMYLRDAKRQHLLGMLDATDSKKPAPTGRSLDANKLMLELDTLKTDIDVFDERTKDQLSIQDFREQMLPMSILPPPPELALPENDLRELYDEVTSEKSSSVGSSQHSEILALGSERSVSETNLSIGELRYQNWKLINHLLAWADKHDRAYEQAVDEAIAAGRVPPPRHVALKERFGQAHHNVGLHDTDAAVEADGGERLEKVDIEKARNEILRLRGLLKE